MKTLEQVFIHTLRDRVSVHYLGVSVDALGMATSNPKDTHTTGEGTLELSRLNEFEVALRERGFARAPEEISDGALYCWTRERDDTALNEVK